MATERPWRHIHVPLWPRRRTVLIGEARISVIKRAVRKCQISVLSHIGHHVLTASPVGTVKGATPLKTPQVVSSGPVGPFHLSQARRPTSERLEDIAGTQNWTWPLLSAAIAAIVTTTLAAVHRQVDLGTYILGGAHAFHPNLYRVVYRPTGLGFTYPPFAAFWFAPMAHLPVTLDQIAFTWCSLAGLLVVLAVCLRVTCPDLQFRTVGWWSLLLLAPMALLDPVRETILLGQVNILLAAAVIVDMTLIRPERRGVLVGLAAAIKITPIILIPYLILTRQAGAWRRATGAFVAAAGLAAVASPQASWTYWSHDVWDPGRAGGLAWVGNQGAVAVIERLLHHPLDGATTLGVVAVIVGAGLLIAVKAHRRSWPVLGFLVVEATESLASPISWSHHFIWIVLLIAWLALAVDRPAHGQWWAAAVAIVFWAAPVWWVPHGPDVKYAGHGWSILLSDSFFLLLAAIVLASSLRLAGRRSITVGPSAFPSVFICSPEMTTPCSPDHRLRAHCYSLSLKINRSDRPPPP